MIVLTICNYIFGCSGWVDAERYGKATLDWLRTFFPFKNGIPSHDLLGRRFGRLDTVEFQPAMEGRTIEIAAASGAKSLPPTARRSVVLVCSFRQIDFAFGYGLAVRWYAPMRCIVKPRQPKQLFRRMQTKFSPSKANSQPSKTR